MKGVFLLIALPVISCTEARVRKYQALFEPRLQKGMKTEFDSVLGQPAHCFHQSRYLVCEYHTAYRRNAPVSSVYRKEPGFGMDLSPLDQFDVLRLYYDGFGILQEWKPVTIRGD